MTIDNDQSRVFITQERESFNYSTAQKYGQLVPVTARDVSNVPNSLHNEDLYESICATLRDFDSDHDYLLPSGSPLVTGLCFAVLTSFGHTYISVLRYDGRNFEYIPVQLQLQPEREADAR